MLNDRKCTSCGLDKEDLLEDLGTVQKELIQCPLCDAMTFKKIHRAPYIETDGKYSFLDTMDRNRQAAADGHGNHSYKI